jgi:hypothetical protein
MFTNSILSTRDFTNPTSQFRVAKAAMQVPAIGVAKDSISFHENFA